MGGMFSAPKADTSAADAETARLQAEADETEAKNKAKSTDARLARATKWVGAAFIVLTLVPFLRWLTSTYTLTDRRVITRHGIVTTTGHDLPLSRINNVTYERSLLDRLLGCGTLQFTTAAEAPVTLPDVPDVERVHVVMTELLFGDAEGDNRGPEGRD